jgi:hypothetical protein
MRCGTIYEGKDEPMRQYAQFFEAADGRSKTWKEKFVANSFLASPVGRALGWHSPTAAGSDPPDVICLGKSNEPIALEVTEFVDQHAIESAQCEAKNRKNPIADRAWNDGTIRSEVARILDDKDRKRYSGGPFADVCVCIFTDERLLLANQRSQAVHAVAFGPFTQITRAFVLLSYDPSIGGYPVIELRIYGRREVK